MRVLLAVGVILLILGVASFFVPVPRTQRRGIDIGGVSLGVETTSREIVHPSISAALIAGGVLLVFVGVTGGRRK